MTKPVGVPPVSMRNLSLFLLCSQSAILQRALHVILMVFSITLCLGGCVTSDPYLAHLARCLSLRSSQGLQGTIRLYREQGAVGQTRFQASYRTAGRTNQL